jgi:hypothetical protein
MYTRGECGSKDGATKGRDGRGSTKGGSIPTSLTDILKSGVQCEQGTPPRLHLRHCWKVALPANVNVWAILSSERAQALHERDPCRVISFVPTPSAGCAVAALLINGSVYAWGDCSDRVRIFCHQDKQTDGQTNGRTDKQTNGWTDGQLF